MSSVEVAYSIVGAGPPLYMVHGIGSCKATWEALIKDLRTDFTCVSLDLRGHGESPVPPVPYSLDELVEDLEALRQRLGHQRIHVVGHSLGGQIGPAYARTHQNVWRQSHFSVRQQAGLLRIVPRSRVWSL